MDQRKKDRAKRTRLHRKELEKLAEKVEKYCFPLQSVLLRIANNELDADSVRRADALSSKLSMVTAGLHQLHEASFRRGGGASEHSINRLIGRSNKSDASSKTGLESKSTPTLRGKVPEFPLSSVLEFISKENKSGSLAIELSNEVITFGIIEGEIVHTSTNRTIRGERLGEILVDRGEVTQHQFTAFIDEHRGEGQMMGMSLVSEEIVSQDALTAALVEQMQKRFDRAFGAKNCSFAFYENAVDPNTGLNINVSELLFDGGRTSSPTPMSLQSDKPSRPSAGPPHAIGKESVDRSGNEPEKL